MEGQGKRLLLAVALALGVIGVAAIVAVRIARRLTTEFSYPALALVLERRFEASQTEAGGGLAAGDARASLRTRRHRRADVPRGVGRRIPGPGVTDRREVAALQRAADDDRPVDHGRVSGG